MTVKWNVIESFVYYSGGKPKLKRNLKNIAVPSRTLPLKNNSSPIPSREQRLAQKNNCEMEEFEIVFWLMLLLGWPYVS